MKKQTVTLADGPLQGQQLSIDSTWQSLWQQVGEVTGEITAVHYQRLADNNFRYVGKFLLWQSNSDRLDGKPPRNTRWPADENDSEVA